MNKVKFPEIIDKYYDDALNAQYEREEFKRLYNCLLYTSPSPRDS